MDQTPSQIQSTFTGIIGDLLHAVTQQWLLPAPQANPALLEMFADRDTPPYRNLLPWSGEFAGKYFTAAALVLRISPDPRLKAQLTDFVARLASLQDADGYLGPWPKDSRLTNFSSHHAPGGLLTWDTWGHYHVMWGLLLWHEDTQDQSALDCACRIADLICVEYLGERSPRLVETGSTEMNLAPVHALARLYRVTGVERYLRMALQIVDEFGARDQNGPLAGDYLAQALAGRALYQMPKPRWESLHPILGLAELYRITGEETYRAAFERIWWGIVENDRHNNGGFSSGEQANGNPYDPGAIETCCTIAWIALSVEMLRLTQDSIVADEIELSTLNSVLGMHSTSGRWATYNTPSDGARFASAHHIVFQARSGSPELNCCSVNSPRGLGMLGDWALLVDGDALLLNYYGPCAFTVALPNGARVEIRQETEYPLSGKVRIQVTSSSPAAFTLKLRIPHWSMQTRLSLNGQALDGIQPGQYYALKREWAPGDALDLSLDFSLHFWTGEHECQGLVSAYRGPLLLAFDQRLNRPIFSEGQPAVVPADPAKVDRSCLPLPDLDAASISPIPLAWDGWLPPWLLLKARTTDGRHVYLCDFASAGQSGALYRSWLPLKNAPPSLAFSHGNPLRSGRKPQHLKLLFPRSPRFPRPIFFLHSSIRAIRIKALDSQCGL
jgi:DUF1680 family protein